MRERVIIHTPRLCVCVSESGVLIVPAYDLPKNFIQGTTGAGDAFCAGALCGIYQEKNDEDILELAAAAAVSALSKADATSGVKNEREILKSVKEFPMQKL